MIPWIQVYSNILTHDKTYRLAEDLKIPNYSAVGLMVSLWCWVAVNAPDGDISNYPPRALSEATGWNKKPETFYAALINADLIEQTEDGRKLIRNWEQYAILLMDLMENQKKQTAARVRRHREKKKKQEAEQAEKAKQAQRYSNVTDTAGNALPDITLPNLTLPDQSSYDDFNNPIVVDGGRAEDAEQVVDDFMRQRALTLSSFPGVSQALQAQTKALTDQIFDRFVHHVPQEQDVARVYQYTADTTCGTQKLSQDKANLLMYAFEQAGNVGAPGNWKYIVGCLSRLHSRGITTLAQAEAYDDSRLEGAV